MKIVILSAFHGRLRSEPMEWPNEPPTIDMPVSRASYDAYWNMGMAVPAPATTIKIGRFEHTGKYEVLPTGRTAAVYELVGL